jgi:hypothetical protein
MSRVINLNLDVHGRRGYVGWADGAEMEHLREAFAFETDAAKQQPTATELQRLLNEVFSIPLGGYKVVTGHPANVRAVAADQILVFWNMERAWGPSGYSSVAYRWVQEGRRAAIPRPARLKGACGETPAKQFRRCVSGRRPSGSKISPRSRAVQP